MLNISASFNHQNNHTLYAFLMVVIQLKNIDFNLILDMMFHNHFIKNTCIQCSVWDASHAGLNTLNMTYYWFI